MRIGHGYDVHRLSPDRRLVLGGVEIPWDRGLLGHSDADVLLHAVADSMLGAAGMGDIGLHFPDTDDAYKGISSMLLLEKTVQLLKKAKYEVVNIDATVIAQQPKLRPYISEMEQNIAKACEISDDKVNVKATTEEGMGFTGRFEGISAQCVCLIETAAPRE